MSEQSEAAMVALPAEVTHCGACGNAIERRGDGPWIDPNERENQGDLCLLNEPEAGYFGPHEPIRQAARSAGEPS